MQPVLVDLPPPGQGLHDVAMNAVDAIDCEADAPTEPTQGTLGATIEAARSALDTMYDI